MGKDEEGGYRVEVPDEALKDALESVSKYDRKNPKPGSEEIETVVEVEVGADDSDDEQEILAVDAGQLEGLASDLEQARQEAKDNHEKMLRVAADADNIRKRALKEREEAIKFGRENLLQDILPVIDNMERTLAHVPKKDVNPSLDALRQGVEMVLKLLTNVMEKHDVRAFDSLGEPFDPKRHEALSRLESAEAAPNTIVDEAHRGYMLHDRLLRAALVTVACSPITDEIDKEDSNCPEGAEKPSPSEPEPHEGETGTNEDKGGDDTTE